MGNACPFQTQVEAYHDGELADATARANVERHLAGCTTCAADLAWLSRLTATLAGRDGADDGLTPDELARVYDAVDAEADAAEAATFDIRRLYRAAVALTAVAASILVLSCAWLNTLPTQRGGHGGPNQQSVAAAPSPDAWERVAMTLRADPIPASGPNGEVYVAYGDLPDLMLRGLDVGETTR